MKFLILVLYILSFSALSVGNGSFPHHTEDTGSTTVVEQTIIEQTIIQETTRYSSGAGIAGAMAQHHFNYGSYAFQKSIGYIYIDSEENIQALSISGAKRNCRDCGLLNFTFAIEDDPYVNKLHKAYGIGYTWIH